jgi:hypothetical protein
MTGNLPLKPDTRSPFVRMRFYGGPRDGDATHCVTVKELKGRIDQDGHGWHYALIGFMEDSVPQSLKQFAMESAVYEWTNGR